MSGISDISVALNISNLTMRYEDGGRTQVYCFGDREVKIGGSASTSEVIAILTKEKNKAE